MVPSILGFTGALARRAGPVMIVTPTPSDESSVRVPEGVDLLGPEADFERLIPEADVAHFHGLWQQHTRRGVAVARRHRIPYLIAAHGMAEPWALRHKALKKRVYTALIEGKNLRRAACLHALSRPEVGHLRRLAPKALICLVPNGVDLAPIDDLPARAVLEAVHPELTDKFVVLFLGRLHVKKGLDLLARATATLAPTFPSLHLLVAGADDGALTPFLEVGKSLGIADRITLLGHVAGEDARRAWGAADAFILPSYSEGFSMAVLEALAARRPTIITTACHFPELSQAGGGLTAEPTVSGITRALDDLLRQSPAERRAMAECGRALVESRYTWDQQATRLADVYRWVQGGGPAPEAVVDPGWTADASPEEYGR
jgi:glycosyltransferase involved in cell wall biosynthesis